MFPHMALFLPLLYETCMLVCMYYNIAATSSSTFNLFYIMHRQPKACLGLSYTNPSNLLFFYSFLT